MAVTYTTNLGLAKPDYGTDPWASYVNNNWDALDSAFEARTYVTLRSFGAVGDGTTDDTAALQAALASAYHVIDGEGLIYKFTTNLTCTVAKHLRNARIKPVGTTPATPALKFSGTAGSPVVPSADIAAGATSFTTATPGSFTDEQWVYFASTLDFSSTTKCGELARIKSISGGTVNLYSPLALAYAAADSFTVTPLTMLSRVILDDVECIGDTGVDNLSAFWFYLCDGTVLRNPVSTDCDYLHIIFERCARFRVFGGSGDRTGTTEGLDYGIVVSKGSYDGKVFGYTGTDTRHTMTIGGSAGVSRFIYGIGCHAEGSLDAGFDCHPAAIEHGFINCTVNMSTDALENEGFVSQGTEPTFIGNNAKGVHRHGFLWQPTNSIATLRQIGKFKDNDATGSTGDRGYLISTANSAAPIADVVLSGNSCDGFAYCAEFDATASNISHITAKDNAGQNCTAKGILLRADTGYEISSGVVHGNSLALTGGSALEQVYLLGVGTGRVKNVALGANNGSGGTIGLRYANTDNCVTDGTNNLSAATKLSIDTASTRALFREVLSTITITNATYTLTADVDKLIANRASTITVTLPAASSWLGRKLYIKTIQAQLVVSAASDVVPIDSATAGTAILPATDGAWALLESDGTNWITLQKG